MSDKPREHLCEESDRKRLRVCPTPALGALHSLSNESAKTDEPGRAGPGRPRTSGLSAVQRARTTSRVLQPPAATPGTSDNEWSEKVT